MKIRNMHEGDLGFCMDRIRDEGWLSETEDVFREFLRFHPDGCFIGEEDGRPVGLCVGVAYGECGFIGELIVTRTHRGRGLGRRLIEHAIRHLRDRGCRSIYLDGDQPAVRLYERLGFSHVCRSLRFLGRVPKTTHSQVRPMTFADIATVAARDREAFGADRRFFLESRLRLFPDLCSITVAGDGRVAFCMARPGNGVLSIGPWYVDGGIENPADLIESIAAGAGDLELRLGVLETNSRALRVIHSLNGLTEKVPSWRMVLGPDVGLGSSERLYAIGSPAKG